MVLSDERIHKIILEEINQTVTFTPNKYNVVTTFNKLNKACFNNKLKLPKINLNLQKNYLGYFKYDGYSSNNNNLINPILSVNGAYEYNMNQFESVIAHEMIHYYLAKTGVDPNCSHGVEFQQIANQLNSKFGLTIDETVDTGGMNYGTNNNSYTPNSQSIRNLGIYFNTIKKYNDQMKNDMKNKGGDVGSFCQVLYQFDISLLNALNRCISKKSINEGGEFSKAIGNFRSGYNNWSNTVNNITNKILHLRNYGSLPYGGENSNSAYNNGASLMELLFNIFPNDIEKKHTTINNKTMNALESIGYIHAIMSSIRSLAQYIQNEIQKAQGNP